MLPSQGGNGFGPPHAGGFGPPGPLPPNMNQFGPMLPGNMGPGGPPPFAGPGNMPPMGPMPPNGPMSFPHSQQFSDNAVKSRDYLYRLMISQLFYDGYQPVAVQLTNITHPDPACPPSDRLFNVVMMGLEREAELNAEKRKLSKEKAISTQSSNVRGIDDITDLGPGLDLEFETDVDVIAPEPALYETAYVTSHKASCRAGAFSKDGLLCATGSVDASIKVLDVDRMLAKSSKDIQQPGSRQSQEAESGHPVIRTLYDHFEEVTCLEFHPTQPILASGSRDCTVKLFDYSKVSAKKASRTICDAAHIETISFHPNGDFLLVGVMQPVIRMYDITTSQCFVASNPAHQHSDSVTSVTWSPDGKLYASASLDGMIKIWDGVSSSCISTFPRAHDGAEVCSVQFARNGKYVLSSGKDSLVKLWEMATTRCLIAYTGAGATGKQEYRSQAIFNHTEDYVMFPDEATTSLCCWDSRSASRRQLLSLGHNGAVRHIVHSPTSSAFLTCSDDFRARFWVRRLNR